MARVDLRKPRHDSLPNTYERTWRKYKIDPVFRSFSLRFTPHTPAYSVLRDSASSCTSRCYPLRRIGVRRLALLSVSRRRRAGGKNGNRRTSWRTICHASRWKCGWLRMRLDPGLGQVCVHVTTRSRSGQETESCLRIWELISASPWAISREQGDRRRPLRCGRSSGPPSMAESYSLNMCQPAHRPKICVSWHYERQRRP